jgi:hypothetical protein
MQALSPVLSLLFSLFSLRMASPVAFGLDLLARYVETGVCTSWSQAEPADARKRKERGCPLRDQAHSRDENQFGMSARF